MSVKLAIFDVDGTLTDGTIAYLGRGGVESEIQRKRRPRLAALAGVWSHRILGYGEEL